MQGDLIRAMRLNTCHNFFAGPGPAEPAKNTKPKKMDQAKQKGGFHGHPAGGKRNDQCADYYFLFFEFPGDKKEFNPRSLETLETRGFLTLTLEVP